MSIDADALAAWTAGRLIVGSLEGALAVALVWMACRWMPRLPAGVQASLWWLAAVKLVLALAPLPTLTIPILPATAEAPERIERLAIQRRLPPALPALSPLPLPPPSSAAAPRPRTATPADPGGTSVWLAALVGVWLAALAGHGIRLLRGHRAMRAVVRRSTPGNPDEEAIVARLSHGLGLRRLPDVRLSAEVDTPLVVGIVRPAVVLPAGLLATLTPAESEMVLCHELMHVRRRDLVLGLIPAAAERLFFFHPLARFAAREYLTTREAACDVAVVRMLGVSPPAYGRLLVRLGIVRTVPALAANSSAVTASSLRRRLIMLNHAESTWTSRQSAWCLAAALVLAAVPVRLVANPPDPQAPAAPSRVEAPPPPAPAVPFVAPSSRPVQAAAQAPAPLPRPVQAAPPPPAPSARPVQAPPPAPLPRPVQAAAPAPPPLPRPVQAAAPPPPPSPRPVRPAAMPRGASSPRPAVPVVPSAPAPPSPSALPSRPAAQERPGRGAREPGAPPDDLARTIQEITSDLVDLRRRLPETHPDLARLRGELDRAMQGLRRDVAEGIQDARASAEAAQNAAAQAAAEQAIERQLEAMARQQQMLQERRQQLAEQQEALVEAQRQLSDHLQRIRDAIERATRELSPTGPQFE